MHERDAEVLHLILTARGGFGHREHLELAWAYLSEYPFEYAEQAMAAAIRHVANLHGSPDRYHDTITRSWVKLVAIHRDASETGSFDEFITCNPDLLDRHLLDRHYSAAVLWSQAARVGWVAPDRLKLPAHAS